MFDVLNQIAEFGIVPVIKIDDAQNAVPLGKALCDGGLPIAEITFRTAAAVDIARPKRDGGAVGNGDIHANVVFGKISFGDDCGIIIHSVDARPIFMGAFVRKQLAAVFVGDDDVVLTFFAVDRMSRTQ